jgi:hypothetical protein
VLYTQHFSNLSLLIGCPGILRIVVLANLGLLHLESFNPTLCHLPGKHSSFQGYWAVMLLMTSEGLGDGNITYFYLGSQPEYECTWCETELRKEGYER